GRLTGPGTHQHVGAVGTQVDRLYLVPAQLQPHVTAADPAQPLLVERQTDPDPVLVLGRPADHHRRLLGDREPVPGHALHAYGQRDRTSPYPEVLQRDPVPGTVRYPVDQLRRRLADRLPGLLLRGRRA